MANRKAIHKIDGFLILTEEEIQNQDLSYEALGLYVYLLSLPDDQTIDVEAIPMRGKDILWIASLIYELEEKGYLEVEEKP